MKDKEQLFENRHNRIKALEQAIITGNAGYDFSMPKMGFPPRKILKPGEKKVSNAFNLIIYICS